VSEAFRPDAFFEKEFDEHATVLASTRKVARATLIEMTAVCVASIRAGGKIMFFGNGGSAADAQHLATELSVRYINDREPISAIALTTDSSAITAAGNDLGFDQIFARQVRALGKPGDVAFGISTSGRSRNVIDALKAARTMSIVPVALTGGDGGELPKLTDHCLIVPSRTTARIQEMHITVGQMLCGALEIELGLV